MSDRPQIKKESALSYRAKLRMRMGGHDVHYAGNLVDGARILQMFGDLATELLIFLDGDEGLFRAYENIEFLAPVFGGDYIEAEASICHIGTTSRKMTFEARKVIVAIKEGEPGYISASSAQVLSNPITVCRATGTCVTPKEYQRNEIK